MRSIPFHVSLENHGARQQVARSVITGVAALAALLTIILVWALYLDYRHTLQQAGERLETRLWAYSSSMDVAFVSADHALRDAGEDVRWLGELNGDLSRLRPLLLRHLLEAPALDSLILYRPDGSTAISVGQAGALGAAAPDWVRTAIDSGTETQQGSSDGRFCVSMLVSAPDGSIKGALLAAIDTERILGELESGEGYANQYLMLLDSDNRLIMELGPGSYQGMNQLVQQLKDRLELNGFNYQGTRLQLDADYLFALRQLSQHPIRVLAAVDRGKALSGWEFRTALTGSSLLLVLIIILAYLRQWRENSIRERQSANDLVRLYQAIEQMPSSILITDLEGRTLYVNRACLEQSGYPLEEVLGKKPPILDPECSSAEDCNALWRRLKSEQVWEGEFVNRLRDGRERIEQTVITPVRDVDGRVSSYFAISTDITEKRAAEEGLFLYRLIVDASSEMLALIDRDYRYRQVNNSYLAYHGRSREQIEGRTVAEVWGSAFFNEQIRHQLDGVFAGKSVSYDLWYDFAGRGRRYCRVSCNPVPTEGGRIETAVVNISDLTDLKHSEEALKTNEERFRALTEHSPMGIFEADAQGHNIYSNHRFCALVGRSPEQMRGFGWMEVVHEEDRPAVRGSWQKTIQQQETSWFFRVRLIRADGSVGWFQSSARRYEDEHLGEAHYIGSVLDVTEQVEHQQLLENKNLELERLSSTDALTGLINRGHLEQLLKQEIHRSERYGSFCGLIMVDVDHFKEVNDSYGHGVGDQVLRHLAELMRTHTRLSDSAGRWGGEEFLIFCPHTDLAGTNRLAEALRKRIEQTRFPVIGTLTCSLGVTVMRAGDQLSELLQRVDEALYRAKNGGRNRVEVIEPEPQRDSGTAGTNG